MSRTAAHAPARTAASAAGNLLGGVFGAVAAVRPKPLHPRGHVVRGRLERTGTGRTWGVPWLDDPGSDTCLVRLSRSLGLPEGWPDVLGLTVRLDRPDGPHDLLLASTGWAPGARHVLVPRTDALSTRYGSLFTYATPAGPAVLGAAPESPESFALHVAPPLGSWERFGTLQLEPAADDAPDRDVAFDPVTHPLPGMALSPLLQRLREPAYAAARRVRDLRH